MIDPEVLSTLKTQIEVLVAEDRKLLESLLDEARPLQSKEQRINPRSAMSVALVGTDGGNNQLQFDPFLVQIVRIVDSSNNELWLEAVGPNTPLAVLNAVHLDPQGN